MNYMKKSCILRQIKQGFSGDGKTLSGIVKLEQYGRNLSAEVSIINFAPLSAGEYYCLLADPFGSTELLPLRGKSLFNILSKLDLSLGFCALICFAKNELVPIAYGINGERQYSFKQILLSAFPQTKSKGAGTSSREFLSQTAIAGTSQIEENAKEESTSQTAKYNDELVAEQNYFSRQEDENERRPYKQNSENAHTQSANQAQPQQDGQDVTKNEHSESVLNPFATDPDGYYRAVKEEIDELFAKYPKDQTLNGIFSCSEWVRVKGEESSPEYLVGVIYENWRAKYICYALPAENAEVPPDEIKDVCTFVPLSAFTDKAGFFVIFQSAESGECIRPESL